jgi:hypothetical protein
MAGLDLTVLNPVTWYPVNAPIQRYKSLIWNEKFFGHSDFVLKTVLVQETLSKLPLGTLLGLRGSPEVMIVEKHTIDVDSKGFQTLTVTGRSVTSFIEHRVIGEIRGTKFEAMTQSDLGSVIILLFNSFVNATTFDYTVLKTVPHKNVKDAVANSAITDSTGEIAETNDGLKIPRWLDPGPISTPILDYLANKPYGFRMVRPTSSSWVVSVNMSGVITATRRESITKLCFDIYKGTDRTNDQTLVQPIILDAEGGDLISPEIVISETNLKTEAHVVLDDKALLVRDNDDPSGFSRRVLYLDGGQAEEGFTPQTWEAFITAFAKIKLKEHVKLRLADGEVSPQVGFRFNQDYFLGDLITIRGLHGVWTTARVTEFIHSEDENGVASYPTLTHVSGN